MKNYFLKLLEKIDFDLRFGDYQMRVSPWINYYEPTFQFIPFDLHSGYPYIYIAINHFMLTNSIF